MVNPEGIHTPEAQPSKPYESIHASERFVEMADIIIDRLDPITEESNENYRSAAWSNPVLGENYAIIRERSQVARMAAGRKTNISTYWLNVYSANSKKNVPIARYTLNTDGSTLHSIRSIDSRGGLSFTHTQNAAAARESLTILGEFLPKESERILQESFDKDFEKVAGRYVLSHYAYVSNKNEKTPSIHPERAIDAIVDHMSRVEEIEKSVRKQSKETDEPLVYNAVVDAIRSKPINGRRHSKYRDINLAKVVSKIGSGLYGGWTNKIVIKKNPDT